MIGALAELNDEDLSFDFEEDMGEKDELEEGEIDVTKVDVADWKPEDEVFPDDADDIDEHMVIEQPVTEMVFEDNSEKDPIDLEELRTEINVESDAGQTQTPVGELSKDEKRRLWFKREEKKEALAIKKLIKSPAARNLKQGIISWFFDADLKLFVLKRYDGL